MRCDWTCNVQLHALLYHITEHSTAWCAVSNTHLYLLSLRGRPGIGKLIDDTIRDGNKITVLTALPRSLAIKALKKSNLSPLFQGRIDPENLVSPLHLADFKTISTVAAAANVVTQNEAIRANVEAQRTRARAEGVMGEDRNSSKSVSSLGDRESMRFDGAAVVKCCGLMRKPGSKQTMQSIRTACLLLWDFSLERAAHYSRHDMSLTSTITHHLMSLSLYVAFIIIKKWHVPSPHPHTSIAALDICYCHLHCQWCASSSVLTDGMFWAPREWVSMSLAYKVSSMRASPCT